MNHVTELFKMYSSIGAEGNFGTSVVVIMLNKYKLGVRTQELYKEMIESQ